MAVHKFIPTALVWLTYDSVSSLYVISLIIVRDRCWKEALILERQTDIEHKWEFLNLVCKNFKVTLEQKVITKKRISDFEVYKK